MNGLLTPRCKWWEASGEHLLMGADRVGKHAPMWPGRCLVRTAVPHILCGARKK